VSDCVWLLRHGATEWTQDGRHTGREDVPLSDAGREQARRAGSFLARRSFDRVFVSPQTRARETCSLAGFGERSEAREELMEWDYGEYEGLTDEQTQGRDPGWVLFRDGCPGGESPDHVAVRVDRLLAEVSDLEGACLLVGHGKLLRALAARWVRLTVAHGSVLPMDPAAISVLECEPGGPLLRLWNFTGQLVA
jgi:broad specificity phosphatase PhoE